MRPAPLKPIQGFTLLEILAAMAVLSLLGGMILMMISASSATAKRMGNNFDSLAGARAAGNRIQTDWTTRPKLLGAAAPAVKFPGNDTLAFYSFAPAQGTERGLAAVHYRVRDGALGLERATLRIGWETAPLLSVSPAPTPGAEYQLLAPMIIRMEIAYVLPNGTLAAEIPAGSRAQSLVLTYATLEESARNQLSEADTRQIVDSLADSGTASTAGLWAQSVKVVAGDDSFSRHMASLKIYERSLPLP